MGFFLPLLAAGAGAASGAGVAAAGTGIAGALAGMGTGLAVFGTLASGISQYNQYKYNADVAKQQAQATQVAADYERYKLEKQGQLLRGKQIASAVGQGIVPFFGSPLEVQIEGRTSILQDMNALFFNTRNRVSQFNQQSDFFSMAAPMALGTSLINAGAFAASGISDMMQYGIPKSTGSSLTTYGKLPGGGTYATSPR
jgi:hypothetical protein